MSEITTPAEILTKTSHLDEAQLLGSKTGITLPSGAYMSQQESLPGSNPADRMRDLIAGLAKALVDSPEIVSVEVIPEPTSTVLRLHVAANDIGKVIGKQGRTARSIRTILSAASMKLQHRFSLDIVEEGISDSTRASIGTSQE